MAHNVNVFTICHIRDILSLVALVTLGLCLLCGLVRIIKPSQVYDDICRVTFFIAVLLLCIIQLLQTRFLDHVQHVHEDNIPYNLGDFIRSRQYRERGWTNDPNYTAKFIRRHPESIGAEYYLLNSRDRQKKIEYYDDDNINYDLLKAIVDRRAKNKGIKANENIYIHLRVGDVIDNPGKFDGGVWINDNSGKDYMEYLNEQQVHINNFEYVKPLKYYKDQEEKISKMFGKDNTITIIAYNYDKNKESNSYKYTMAIHDFFTEKGYNVEITYNNDVDTEFISLCKGKYFVPSGGGFSFLVDRIRQQEKHYESYSGHQFN